jgi:hypothetical protein
VEKKMEALRTLLSAKGLDRDAITVKGAQELRFVENRPHYLGTMVDEYAPVIPRLTLETPSGTVDLTEGTPEFSELAQALQWHSALPLYKLLFETNAPAVKETAEFSTPYGKLDRLVALNDEELDALVANDDATLDDIAWRRFQLTDFHTNNPQYGRREYEEVMASRINRYRAHNVSDYFDWHARSSALFDGNNDFTETVSDKFRTMIDRWAQAGTDVAQVKYQLCRALSVHPMHEARVHDLADEEFARRAPSPPSLSPSL